MKKLLIALTVTSMCVGAFAQGKLAFANDSLHLVYFTTDATKLNAADVSLAGSATSATTVGSLAGTPTLNITLWGGTTAGSLSLLTTTTVWNAVVGKFTAVNTTFATLPAGTAAYFQVQVYDARATSAADAWSHIGWYAGESSVFTAVPQVSSYNPMYQTTSPVLSTWAPGTQANITGAAAGSLGAIGLFATVPVPEPGSFALAGLGLASLLIFRRRK